jgi:hypothetical protein
MKTVWKFTNQKELDKSQFTDYIERKVFRTIRKHQMLPKHKIINLKKSQHLNTAVLKKILEKKFTVKFSSKSNLSSDNLSQSAENIFENILKGKFIGSKPDDKPLNYLSDKEIELYAKLEKIKGTKRKSNKKIQNLFGKFLEKNQDLELNIVKAMSQIQ